MSVTTYDFTAMDSLSGFTTLHSPSPTPLSNFSLDGAGLYANTTSASFIMHPEPIFNGIHMIELDLVSEDPGGNASEVRLVARNQPLSESIPSTTYLAARHASPASGSSAWSEYRIENNTAQDSSSTTTSSTAYKNKRVVILQWVIGGVHAMETWFDVSDMNDLPAPTDLGPGTSSSIGPKLIPNSTFFASPGLWGIRLANTLNTRVRKWRVCNFDATNAPPQKITLGQVWPR